MSKVTRLLVALLALTPTVGHGAGPEAVTPTLAPWEVLSGQGEVSSVEGTALARLTGGHELVVVSAAFPVHGDTIYRVKLQLKREQDLRVYARLQEMVTPEAGPLHGLAFWPGYALPPPEFMDLYSCIGTSPGAKTARINLIIWPGQSRKTGETALRGLELTPVGKVDYPATDSANLLLNGACEAADERGVALYWQSWGGSPESRRIVPGVGRNGTSALAIGGRYLLSSPVFAPRVGRRYRLGGWFKGAGTVSFELRGFHRWEILAMGQASGQFTAIPDDWRWFSMETVALPGHTQMAPVISLAGTGDNPMLIDDISLVEVGLNRRG